MFCVFHSRICHGKKIYIQCHLLPLFFSPRLLRVSRALRQVYSLAILLCTEEHSNKPGVCEWVINGLYRRLGFLAVIWFGSSPTVTHGKTEKEKQIADGRRGEGGGGGAKYIRQWQSLVLYNTLNTFWWVGSVLVLLSKAFFILLRALAINNYKKPAHKNTIVQ